jgi:hypothetical protein
LHVRISFGFSETANYLILVVRFLLRWRDAYALEIHEGWNGQQDTNQRC